MIDTPRGRRLQIHLSTAIVLMIGAGAFVWANVVPIVIPKVVDGNCFTVAVEKYGWPCLAMDRLQGGYSMDDLRVWNSRSRARIAAGAFIWANPKINVGKALPPAEYLPDAYSIYDLFWGAGLDFGIAIIALGAIGCGCEWRIRRKAGNGCAVKNIPSDSVE